MPHSPDLSTELAEWGKNAAHCLRQRQWLLVSAESCTGGWLAKIMTDEAGSSAWFERGFVTYSNRAKQDLLQVPSALLEQYGAVSEAVVQAMAQGALILTPTAHCSVAISGIAGPSGGTALKPVGMVCFAWATRQQITTQTEYFATEASRATLRAWAVKRALQGICQQLQALSPLLPPC